MLQERLSAVHTGALGLGSAVSLLRGGLHGDHYLRTEEKRIANAPLSTCRDIYIYIYLIAFAGILSPASVCAGTLRAAISEIYGSIIGFLSGGLFML